MTYTVGGYIQSIAMVIIFTTFVNLIMPGGEFQKYIKIVLGLIVIITILAPINTIAFKNKPNYSDFLKKYEIGIENSTSMLGNEIYFEAQQEIILDSYKERLKNQMIDIIEKANKVKVIDLEIGLNEDQASQEFGNLTRLNIVVEETEDVSNKKIKIPKVRVGNKPIKGGGNEGNEGEIEKNIKNSLIDFYNLSQVNINITVQKNS